jgi:hypothetical protein
MVVSLMARVVLKVRMVQIVRLTRTVATAAPSPGAGAASSTCVYGARPGDLIRGIPQSVSCAVELRHAAFPFLAATMIDSFARVSGWEQLYHLWELLVIVAKFLWGLLRLLGGG